MVEFEVILDFIAQDNLTQALLFYEKLEIAIFSLPEMSYKCRQSTKASDENIRDLIFKGYVIPYRINKAKKQLEMLGIFSENNWNLSF